MTVDLSAQTKRLIGGARPNAGKLRLGAVSANGGVGSKASIPTRFETILNTGHREQDAFGTRTFRFGNVENELPGPGTYRKNRSILSQSKFSFSKQGLAAFAKPVGLDPNSKPAAAAFVPGPGAYHRGDSNVPTKDGKTTAAFAAPTPKPVLRIVKPTSAVPGPGQYNVLESPRRIVGAPRITEPRNPSPTRGSPSTTPAPGPGEYISLDQYSTFKPRDPTRKSAFAASSTDRFKTRHLEDNPRVIAKNLPTLLTVVDDIDRSNVSTLIREVRSPRPSVQEAPKPKSPTSYAKSSPMFAETNLDRFGRPIVRYTAPDLVNVGPGSYELEKRPKRMLISSSWALSGSRRDELQDHIKPPGPAYYTPQLLPSHVSHRVTDSHVWS